MATSVVDIGWWEVALASAFMLAAGVISVGLRLGLVRDLFWATLRTYGQLVVLGFALRWVFGASSAGLVLLLLALMSVMAAQIATRRVLLAPRGLILDAAVSMTVVGFGVTLAVTGLVVRVEPWFEAE